MKQFYCDVSQNRGKLLVRGYDEDGKRVHKQVKYGPTLYVNAEADSPSKYRTIKNKPVAPIKFSYIGEARDFVKKYENVDGFDIYGMTNWQYPYIFETYSKGKPISYDRSLIRIGWIDIETEMGNYTQEHEVTVKNKAGKESVSSVDKLWSIRETHEVFDEEKGEWSPVLQSCYFARGKFPDIEKADKAINAITLKLNEKNYVFGFYDYVPKNGNTNYIKCKDEAQMLQRFITLLKQLDLDIISSWNGEGFDIPYITNRIITVFNEDKAKELSPWRIIDRRKIFNKQGQEIELVNWVGIACLDYLNVYKKFRSATEEMYKLDYIASVELGVGKVDYAEYGNLHNLYLGNKQLFYEYNERDVTLLYDMEKKLKIFDVQFSLSYFYGVNYVDTFGTVRPWDVRCHNYLMARNIVVPQKTVNTYEEQIEGAFVKEHMTGRHKWVVSFDVKSLYPSLTRQCNISPETLIRTLPNISVEQLLRELELRYHENKESKNVSFNKIVSTIKEHNAGLCATGVLFDNDAEGFAPALMREVYEERVKFQAELKKYKKLLEKAKQNKEDTSELEGKVAYYHAQQYSRKIGMNSFYGAMANQYFRWFDTRLAESITLTGQVTIRWVWLTINRFLNQKLNTTDKDYISYGDSDSCYINLGDWVKYNNLEVEGDWHDPDTYARIMKTVQAIDDFCKTELQEAINLAFKQLRELLNHRESVLDMNRENIASSAFWCCHPDTQVIINGTPQTIEEFYNRNSNEILPGIKPCKNSTLLSVNAKKLNSETDAVMHVMRREITDAKLVTIHFENGNYISVTPEHLIAVNKNEKLCWVKAEDIKLEHKLFYNGGTSTISSVNYSDYSGYVYDIETDKNHNFFANGVLIHNCAKKRYAMNVWDSEGDRYKEPKPKISGLEAIKGSSPRICRPMLKKAITVILNDGERDLQSYVLEARQEFNSRPFEEIAITKNCNNVNKYSDRVTIYTKGCPIGVRGVLVYNNLVKKLGVENTCPLIRDGDKVKLCYLLMPNPANSNVIACPDELPTELGLDDYLDRNAQFDKTFMQPLESMANAVEWSAVYTPDLSDLFE